VEDDPEVVGRPVPGDLVERVVLGHLAAVDSQIPARAAVSFMIYDCEHCWPAAGIASPSIQTQPRDAWSDTSRSGSGGAGEMQSEWRPESIKFDVS